MSEQHPKKRGFAAISPERMREIASAGGIARKRAYDQARAAKKNGTGIGAPAQEQTRIDSEVTAQG